MKATDLMIGDWVLWRGTPLKIMSINDKTSRSLEPTVTGLITIDGKETIRRFNAKSLKPIPITPEILEKNGFISNKYNINDVFGTRFNLGKYYYLTFYNSNGGGSLTKYFKSQSGFYITTIEYVHELQHALRLYGIEKKVKL